MTQSTEATHGEFIQLNGGPHDGARLGVKLWPPPEEIPVRGSAGRYVRIRMSQLTDEQQEEMTFIVRGAEYEWRGDDESAEDGL